MQQQHRKLKAEPLDDEKYSGSGFGRHNRSFLR
jgi:hypothetical protein